MSDLSITAANVIAGENSVQDRQHNAGEAITAGKTVYLASATKLWMLADSNSGTAEAKRPGGIALNGAAAGQPLAVHKSGDITLGAILTAGAPVYQSETPGGMQLTADLGSGETVTSLGLAKSASVLAVDIQYPGVTL